MVNYCYAADIFYSDGFAGVGKCACDGVSFEYLDEIIFLARDQDIFSVWGNGKIAGILEGGDV